MKHYILSLIIAILFVGCNSDAKEELEFLSKDLSRYELRDSVMSVTEYSYQAIDFTGEIKKGVPRRNEPKYIVRGLTKRPDFFGSALDFQVFFDRAGKQTSRFKFLADGAFRKSRQDTVNEMEKNVVYRKEVYVYDEQNRLIHLNGYANDRLDSKIIYEYNEKGDTILKDHRSGDGSLTERYRYSYSRENGNLMYVKKYNEGGKEKYKHTYTYDDRGNEVKWYNNLLLKYTCRREIKYDTKGRKIRVWEDNSHDPEDTFDYSYDDNGFISKIRRIRRPQRNSRERKTEITISYTYILDSRKNWTQRTEFENGFPKFIVERILEYY